MPQKKKRKCSVCNKTGHDKRKCSQMRESATRENLPVAVQFVQKIRPSQHVVDLKPNKISSPFGQVTAYNDNKSKEIKRVGIDFDHLIKQAVETELDWREELRSRHRQEIKDNKSKKFSTPSLERGEPVKLNISRTTLSDRIRENIKLPAVTFNFKRTLSFAVVLCMIAILPFPALGYYQKLKLDSQLIVEESTNAFLSLQSSTMAALQSDIPQAQYDLNSALVSFDNASSILDKEHRALVYVASVLPIVGKEVSSRQELLSAGHHLALGNSYLVSGIQQVQNGDAETTTKLNLLQAHLRSALPQYQEALEDLNRVNKKVVPVEFQQSFEDFKLLFTAFIDDMNNLADLSKALRLILGDENLKRYLLVFQNNHELRPTGGFMGSFALVDVQKGKMVNWEVPGGGTYDLQGQLQEFVEPPLPLQLVNERWEFQDANWFPDFPASAQKIEWFYQNGRSATTDGVIAINATVLERMLKVLGPMISEDYDLTLVADGALEELQTEVEENYDKEKNQPKEVISGLFGELLEKLKEADGYDLMRLLTELHSALNQKEIQIYLNEEDSQEEFSGYGWTGEIKETNESQDYLMVVNTNIQGGKSDAKILQTIEHQAVVQDDGSVLVTVFIEREHTGTVGEKFYGGNNISYLRLYVPEGSELMDAGGFSWPDEELFKVAPEWYEQDQDLIRLEEDEDFHDTSGTRVTGEFGKTAFGNWILVEPGQKAKVYFTYRLPFKVFNFEEDLTQESNLSKWMDIFKPEARTASRYSLLAQKQSGLNSKFSSTLIYPDGWQPVWRSSDDIELALNGSIFETDLYVDEFYGIVMEEIKD
ncbi:DUF4012 domain-containing protein [Patescibacteria group bacterium]|nr:DUF4012 domain-containing protein [Patescibacteria group bacterium]MBU1895464.1 DUF4012 domain-containing protein [Patescibacteria group bacterium]